MREIKFRGKRVDNGKWVFGNYIRFAGYGFEEHHITSFKAWEENDKVNPATVGQYIEVHDAEDNELYEDDIVKIFTDKWIIAVIKIEYGTTALVSTDFTDGFEYISEYLQIDRNYGWVDCEIIGNIHDNPDMLVAPQAD